MFISVEAVRWVFTQSRSERSARLVLLAIAAHCNEDGRCWPGMDTLIRYTKLSKNAILKARDELVGINELVVEVGGRGPGDTNHYLLSAFMESRVQKGSENPNKGAEQTEKGSTHLNPNKNLEEEVIEESSPQVVSLQNWVAFQRMRERIGKPLTPEGNELVMHELERLRLAGEDPDAVLEQSIRCGYSDVFAVRKERSNGRETESFDERRNRTSAAAINKVAERFETLDGPIRPALPPTDR